MKNKHIIADQPFTDQSYEDCRRIIEGRPFEEIASLPSTDPRFTGVVERRGGALVDLNFGYLTVTVRRDKDGKAELMRKYEGCDYDGAYAKVRIYRMSFLDFCGHLITGNEDYRNSIMSSASKWVDDNNKYVTKTIRLHDGVMVDYNREAMRIVDGTDNALLIRDRPDYSDVGLLDALKYAKEAYKEYVEFVSSEGWGKISIRFSEDGLRGMLPDSRPKRFPFEFDKGWPYRMVYAVPITEKLSLEFVSLENAKGFYMMSTDIFDVE